MSDLPLTSERPTLDGALLRRLTDVAGRMRRYVIVQGVAWVCGFVLAAFVVQFLFDYFARGMRWSMRAALLMAIVGAAGYFVWRLILAPLRTRIGPADVANLVERRHPGLSSHLVSAIRFATGEVGSAEANSPALVASVIRRATETVKNTDFDGVLNPQGARRAGWGLAGMVALCAAVTLLSPHMVGLWFSRNVLLQENPWPRQTRLKVEAKDGLLVGARGDDVIIMASAEGVQPREVDLLFTTAGGVSGRETMVTIGNPDAYRYRYTVKNAQDDLTFHLRGGDDRTDEYTLKLVDRPHIAESKMRFTPPSYTRLPPWELGDGQRAAQILPGTDVEIMARTNKPVVTASLIAGDESAVDVQRNGDWLRVTLRPMTTQTYHFALTDEFTLEDRQPARFPLRVTKDDPPVVRMKLPAVGEMITPEAELPFELEFNDSYGLSTAEVVYEVSREGFVERTIALPDFAPDAKTFTTSLNWAVTTETLIPGERITLRAKAADFDDVNGPNHAQSPPVTLRVVTQDEFLAEMARREQEARLEFEKLVDAQEKLRGDLLSVADKIRTSVQDSDQLAAELTPLERRQRNIASSVHVIRQQFERILGERRVNRLDTNEEKERLSGQIIDPLGQLVTRDMVVAADALRRWTRESAAETSKIVDGQQAEIIGKMREVLATMVQYEGYQEVVNMLRDIMRLQGELNTETRERAQSEADDVFDE